MSTEARPRLPALVLVGLAWSLIINVLNYRSAGGLTLNALATAALAGFVLLQLPAAYLMPLTSRVTGQGRDGEGRVRFTRNPTLPVALNLLGLLVLLNLIIRAQTSTAGFQFACVLAVFLGSIVIVSRSSSPKTSDTSLPWFRWVAVAVTSLYLLSVLLTGLGTQVVYGARSFALTALVLLAVTIPRQIDGARTLVLPFAVTFAIAASLSRTATLIAGALLVGIALRARRGRRIERVLALPLLGLLSAYLAITQVPAIRDRFLQQGDAGLRFGGFALNTNGRTEVWRALYDRGQEALLFGHGPGAAADYTVAVTGNLVAQPHNDYLRLFYDFGAVGLLLWSVGYAALLFGCARRARSSQGQQQHPHIAAALALTAVALAMATDNVIVYPFVMLPLGVLVGLSLASGTRVAEPPDLPGSRHGPGGVLHATQSDGL